MARGHVDEDDKRVETMIASLEANKATAEAERHNAEQLRGEVEQLRNQLEDDREKFREQRDKLLAKAELEAKNAVANARREAEDVIRELRRLALEERGAVKEHKLIDAKRRLDQAVPELRDKRDLPKSVKKKAETIEVGDEVRVASLGQKGQVVELTGSEATVQLGILKMKVNKADLELIKSAPAAKPVQQVATIVKRSRDENIRTELDLRGSNLEEAIIETDRFLDESFLNGFGQVYVIHGKGTGILRAGLQDYFKRHKHVKSYRLGNYGEGGAGVTVVELK
jgi:DNA mismatch repair protein MutS2